MKEKILFLCTGNSCRSQMAEGLLRHLHGDRFDCLSAGLESHGLNPIAVQVMAEIGVDISQQESISLKDLPLVTYDYVITVCGHADENCPYFPGPTTVIHHGFDDPPQLATACNSTEEILGHYRRVRDEIRDYVDTLAPSP